MQNFFCNFCCVLEENGVYCGPDFRKRRHSYEAFPSWTALRSYAITAGLACLMGVSYELFVFPNAFAPAGINGLATMLQYLLHINIGYLSLLINLPLVLLAWKKSTGTSPQNAGVRAGVLRRHAGAGPDGPKRHRL